MPNRVDCFAYTIKINFLEIAAILSILNSIADENVG
jgi:hypothetical protein